MCEGDSAYDATTVRVSYVSSTNLGESHVLVSATNGDGEPCNFSPQSLIGPAGQDLVCKRSQRARLNGDQITILHKETAGSKPVSHTVDVPADRVFTVEYNADQIRRGNTWLLRCKEKGQLMFETLYRTRPVDRGLLEQSRQSGDPTTDFLCRGTQCSVRGEYNAYCRAKLGPLRVVIGTTEQVKQLANTWSARVVEEPKKGATSVKLQCVRDNVVLEPTIMCRDSGPNKCSFEYFKIATCWNQFQDNFPKFQDDIGEKAVKILEMSKGR